MLRKKLRGLRQSLGENALAMIAAGFALIILAGSALLALPWAARSGESIGWFDALSETALYALSGSLAALLLTDTVISTTVLSRIRKNTSLSEKDDTEAITKSVRETLARDSALVRRTLRAFPYAKLYNRKSIEKARAARAKLKADLKQAQLRARAEIDAREEELRLAVQERKAAVKAKKEELRSKGKQLRKEQR